MIDTPINADAPSAKAPSARAPSGSDKPLRAPAHPTKEAPATTREPLVRLSRVGVFGGGRSILEAVDLAIEPGEIVSIVGPNGAGKTTLARVVLGLIKPDEGEVVRRAGLAIGYVPQRFVIDPMLPLTVRRLLTLTRPSPQKAVERALGRVGLDAAAEVPVSALSGGELQRALIARALLAEPALLVLDEPVQGVDLAGQIALYRLIAELRESLGTAVLLISHDLHVVMAETDRVLCLAGHVCCAGTPESVCDNPEFARLFGADVAGALAVYSHRHDHTHEPDGRIVAKPASATESGDESKEERTGKAREEGARTTEDHIVARKEERGRHG